MAGLLNNPMLQLGAGLLAGGGPSLNPANATFGNALAGGLNNLNAMEQEGFKRQLLAEKLRMERERQSMQRQEMRQQQAAERQKQQQIRGLLDSIPDPAMRAQAEGLIAAGGVGSVAGLLNPTPAKPPASVQEYQFAVDQGFPGSYQEWVQSKRPQTNVTTNVGGPEPYEPKDAISKIARDIQYWESQPPSSIRDSTLEALNRKQRAAGTSAEAQKGRNQMEAVSRIASEFNRIAAANPESTGSFKGTATRLKSDDGFLGRAFRVFSKPNVAEAEMVSMENQMLTLLGNALSGAAIPEGEWPKYNAQIPRVTDSTEMRTAKATSFGRMISILNDVQNGRLTKEQAAQMVGFGQSSVPMAPALPGDPAPAVDVIEWEDLPQ